MLEVDAVVGAVTPVPPVRGLAVVGVAIAVEGGENEAPDTVAASTAPWVRLVVTGVPARVGAACATCAVLPEAVVPACAASRVPAVEPTAGAVGLPLCDAGGCCTTTCKGGPTEVTCTCRVALAGMEAGRGVGRAILMLPCGVASVI